MSPCSVLVPGNRWDLLPAAPVPTVSVVVTHFEQPHTLRLVLHALAGQSLPPHEVVVADDGSARPPDVPEGVTLVRQADEGFRAAAARNLGAAATSGDVLVFLDADTVPEPGFVAALTRHAAACPDVLAVGRRRHADLSGDGRLLPEPVWLRQGYEASGDLARSDGRSFRFVISAVLACRRELFDDLGGFDERFVGYGGEDWDLGYRAWNNGAVLVHEAGAVAWHDGPDWAARDGGAEEKAAEHERLARLIPEPFTRGTSLSHDLPDVLVDLPDGAGAGCVAGVLGQDHRDLLLRADRPCDAAVRTLAWTTDQLRRARVRLRLHEPVLLAPHVVRQVVDRLVEGDLGELLLQVDGRTVAQASTTRAAGRARRWDGTVPDVVGTAFGRRVHRLGPRDLVGPEPQERR